MPTSANTLYQYSLARECGFHIIVVSAASNYGALGFAVSLSDLLLAGSPPPPPAASADKAMIKAQRRLLPCANGSTAPMWFLLFGT